MRQLAAVLGLALAGCAALQPASPVDAIVAEALALSRASAKEQAAALARAQEDVKRQAARAAAPVSRLRLATLLATLPAPLRDDARAVELLEPIADPAQPGIGRFAALLAAQVAERQRVAREYERLVREADRGSRERDRVDKERDKREEALRQQLDALRAVERGILEREDKLRRRPR